MPNLLKNLILITAASFLTACSGFFDKDNTPKPTPLTNYAFEIKPVKLWSVRTGDGSGDEYLRLTPALSAGVVYVANVKGVVTAVDRMNGRLLWQVNTKAPITTGPGVGDGIVVVAGRRGDVIALSEKNGGLVWKTSVLGEILAKPAISHGTVIIKSVDGHITALSANDAHVLWAFQQAEPTLILRGASAPQISGGHVIIGFANGNLAKLTLHDGQLIWQQTIAIPSGAFAIQRMIDIDADPLVFEQQIYAATYQGKISSIDWNSSRVLWNHDISSYTGMTADRTGVYVTDAKSHVWGFNADSGLVNWRQVQLEARNTSAPTNMGGYVVVGDAEGFVHWLSKRDGHFAARDFAGAAIYATPIVQNNVLYVLTKNGYLVAYTIR